LFPCNIWPNFLASYFCCVSYFFYHQFYSTSTCTPANPQATTGRSVSWVLADGTPIGAQGFTSNNNHISLGFVDAVMRGEARADVSMLAFRNPEDFVAGNLHQHLSSWQLIAVSLPCELATQVLSWISNQVNVRHFFQHFRGQFGRELFDSDVPPPRVFPNNRACVGFEGFISKSINDDVLPRTFSFVRYRVRDFWGRFWGASPLFRFEMRVLGLCHGYWRCKRRDVPRAYGCSSHSSSVGITPMSHTTWRTGEYITLCSAVFRSTNKRREREHSLVHLQLQTHNFLALRRSLYMARSFVSHHMRVSIFRGLRNRRKLGVNESHNSLQVLNTHNA
jgi:hypothetical protein